MDINNPIVQLCLKGSEAELKKDLDLAKEYYLKAWIESKDNFDQCISAHYLARVQEDKNDIFEWNNKALYHASKVTNNDEIKDLYPSLLLNMGESYKLINDNNNALKYFKLGLDYVKNDDPGSYGDMIKLSFLEKIKELES